MQVDFFYLFFFIIQWSKNVHCIKYLGFLSNISTLFHCVWLQKKYFSLISVTCLAYVSSKSCPFLFGCALKFYRYFSCIIVFSSRFSSKWGQHLLGWFQDQTKTITVQISTVILQLTQGGMKCSSVIKIMTLRNKAVRGTMFG